MERLTRIDTLPIAAYVMTTAGAPLTGGTVTAQVVRASDGFALDWSDNTFKASGWTTQTVALTEVSATLLPGVYHHAGLDLSLTNLGSTDTLYVSVYEAGSGVPPLPDAVLVLDPTPPADVHVSVTATSGGDLTFTATLSRRGVVVTAPVSASVGLFSPTGTSVVASGAMTGPTAQGVMHRTVTGVSLSPATTYYVDVTVTDADGPVRRVILTPTVAT